MDIHVDQAQGSAPVSIVRVHGDIDASNFQQLIDQVQAAYHAGTRNVLLDMSQVGYMSSAGLVAMQAIMQILKGQDVPDMEDGWGALHSIGSMDTSQTQPNFKILSPQPAIDTALDRVGFKDFIAVFTDEAEAVASF